MALPRAVQAQVDNANQIAQQLLEAGVATSGVLEESEQDDQIEESADAAELNPAQDVANGADAETEEVAETEEGEESLAAAPEVEEVKPQEDSFEHKYKTLQGMYSSEKRRNSELSDRLTAMENMLATLNTAPAAKDDDVNNFTPISSQEVEDYGSDLIDIMRRAAREEFDGELKKLRNENEDLRSVVGTVGQRQEVSERDKFYTTLANDIPNWETINSNPGFLGWLEEDDVYAGEPRKVLLRKAFDRSDASRVARFFSGYLNENAAVHTATTSATDATPAPARKPKVDLASLAAPGAGASGSADNTGESSGREWKASEIAAFYKDVSKGRYKGREDVKLRTETQIHAASMTGRILVGQ